MAIKFDDAIIEKHVRAILNSSFPEVYETSDAYNFRCNICGDSKSDKYAKKAYILKNRHPWVYYCHRGDCGVSTTVVKWMKEYFPEHYKRLMMDVMRQNCPTQTDSYNFKIKSSATERDERVDTDGFVRLTTRQDCVDYCEKRKIPRRIYRKWYYCTSGIYNGRIIITFRKPNGKIYYYQARTFNNKNGVKYLSRFGDHVSVYNYYVVDENKPVPVLEGPIDSIFVENSIAVTGLKVKGDHLDKFKFLYFLLDNDKSGIEKSKKLLEQHKYVFNWTKFLKNYRTDSNIKDVNDFILHNTDGIEKLTWEIIEPYFTNNIMDKIFFNWKQTIG